MNLHKDRKIRVSVGKTVNLGNYESLRLDLSYESSIADSVGYRKDLEDEFNEVFYFIDNLLEETILEKGKK